MITDFALGLLAALTASLATFALCVLAAAVWLVRWLAKYAEITVQKDQKGAVKVGAEVRAR